MRRFCLALALLAPVPAFAQALVVPTCGSGTYTPGQLHQLTMDPAGYLCVSTTTARTTEAPKEPEQKKLDGPKK